MSKKHSKIIAFPAKDRTIEEVPESVVEPVPMPAALNNLMIKRYVAAGICLIACIAFLFTLKDAFALALLLPTLYFGYLAFSLKIQFEHGDILEGELLCVSVEDKGVSHVLQNSYTVSFRGTDGELYVFEMPSRRNKAFQIDFSYKLYIHKNASTAILAYEGPVSVKEDWEAKNPVVEEA